MSWGDMTTFGEGGWGVQYGAQSMWQSGAC